MTLQVLPQQLLKPTQPTKRGLPNVSVLMHFAQGKKNAPLGRFSLGDSIPWIVGALAIGGWLGTSHFMPWVSWHSEAPFFLAVLLATGGGILAWRSNARHEFAVLPSAALLPLALLILVLLQYLFGKMALLGDFVVSGLYLLISLMCLALGRALAFSAYKSGCATPGANAMNAIAVVLIVGGLLSSLVAFAQVLQVWESSPWIVRMPYLRRPGANLGQPNHLATLLVMALASVAYMLTARRIGGVLAAALLIVLCAGLALTESRTGVISVFALLIWWGWKLPVMAPGVSRAWVAFVGLIFASMFVAWPSLFNVIQGISGTGLRLGASAGNARADVWPQLLEAVLLRPWLGWGILQTAEAHNAVAHTYIQGAAFSYSHNFVLDLALWVGLPLAALLVMMVSFWLWRRVRGASAMVSWYGLAVALPLGMHSMLEFPFAYAYLLIPAALAIGVMEGASGATFWLRVSFRQAACIWIGTALLALWLAVEYVEAEDEFRVARFELLRVGQTPADHAPPLILLQTQLAALVDSTRISLRPHMPESELNLLRTVAMRYPWSAPQYRYALALALNEREVEAARQLQVMRVQHGVELYLKLRRQVDAKLIETGKMPLP